MPSVTFRCEVAAETTTPLAVDEEDGGMMEGVLRHYHRAFPSRAHRRDEVQVSTGGRGRMANTWRASSDAQRAPSSERARPRSVGGNSEQN